MRRFLYSLALLCYLSGEARASEAGDVLRTKLTTATKVKLDSPEVAAVVDSLAAYDSLVKECAADLSGLKPAEREEFRRLLVDVVRVALRRQLGRLRGATVTWGVEMRDGDSYVARSKVKSGAEVLDVDWVVVREGGDWRLADVVTEGASMAKTWRRSFKSTYSKGGWPALEKKLRRAAGEK